MSELSHIFRNVNLQRYTLVFCCLLLVAGRISAQQDGGVSGLQCSECHAETGWSPLASNRTFSHAGTAFPLEGRHQSVGCRDCHTGTSYEELHDFQAAETECASCHLDIHDGQLGAECESCHKPTSWTSARTAFNHDETQFLLLGAHKAVDCQSCHDLSDPISLANVSLDCFGCHESDFISTTDPNHVESQFPEDCEMCHDVNSVAWTESDFDHDLTAYPLVGTHEQVLCSSCHTGAGFSAPGLECISCHEDDYLSAVVGHQNAEFSTTCTECHAVTQWSDVTWDHAIEADYPLEGEHISATCLDCHINNDYEVDETCETCHDPREYTNIVDHDAAFEVYDDCEECHPGPEGWRPTTWDHNVETDFTLTGAHVSETCFSCHTENEFAIQSTCYSCHQQDYESTAGEDFDHVAQGIPFECETCHNTSDWGEAEFDHDNTDFPLTGVHAATDVTCQDCHADGVYDGLSTTCESCHTDNFDATTNPPHAQVNFVAANCDICHNTTAWAPADWDHNTETDFIIDGSHVSQTCNDCHAGTWIDYAPTTETTCFTCHESDYQSTAGSDFDHGAQNIPTDCLNCHNTTDWGDAEFDHDDTDFPLTGAHATDAVTCNDCHTSGVFDGLETSCASCHTDDFTGAANPNHSDAGFAAADCEICHTATAFTPSEWDHGSETDFTIDGAHVSNTCNDCHDGTWIDYAPTTTTTCYTCHQQDYEDESIHANQGYGTDCLECHTTVTFGDATIDHTPYFPIAQGTNHGGKWETCATCHIDQSDRTNFTCLGSGCHDNEAELLQDHQEEGVTGYSYNSQACYTCHPTGDSDDVFDHATTGFPLEGQHAPLSCDQCHIDFDYSVQLSQDCNACHQDNYETTSNPVHIDAGFNTACEECHTVQGFTPATWNHETTTTYALLGEHGSQTCNACHASPEWTGYADTDNACSTCHTDDYNATTSPDHASANFNTACLDCHNSFTTWEGATFDHDAQYFPIGTGSEHDGEWTTCTAECHIDENNYANFSCGLNGICHEHDQSEMDDEHDDESGYVYESSACYDCHPNGTEEDDLIIMPEDRLDPKKYDPKPF